MCECIAVCVCVCVVGCACVIPPGATENLLVYSLSQKLFAFHFSNFYTHFLPSLPLFLLLFRLLSFSRPMFLFLSLAAVVLAYLFIVIACVKTTNKFLDSNFMQRAAVWQIRQRNAAAATNVDLNLPHSPSAEPECTYRRGGGPWQLQCIYL